MATLEQLWLSAPEGKLCAREQAKAWALRHVWLQAGNGQHGLYSYVAERVQKMKDGKPNGGHPVPNSVKDFFEKVDADPNWYPGKHTDTPRGPKRILTGVKVTAIVSAAKRLKAEGEEPTYSAVVAACPKATLNPNTNEPVDKKLLYTVFKECCYDDENNPEDTWGNHTRLAQSALEPVAMEKRVLFATHMIDLRHRDKWLYDNIVWVDLCRSVLARTLRKASQMAMAQKRQRSWMSQGSKKKSANRRLPPNIAKMASSDTVVVWFVPVLTRGKLHIETLSENFPGETQEGAAEMVAKVRSALNIRFQGATPPKLLFSDRGNGFYDSGSGAITAGYRNALRAHGLKAFFGDDASIQPGQLQDFLLHETAMAWMRDRLKKTKPRQAWTETVDAYRSRLKACAAYCNENYDVEGLCREVPGRLQELVKRQGDRLPK